MLGKDDLETLKEDMLSFVSPGCQRNDLGRTFLQIIVIITKEITNMQKKFNVIPGGRCEVRFVFEIIRGNYILTELI